MELACDFLLDSLVQKIGFFVMWGTFFISSSAEMAICWDLLKLHCAVQQCNWFTVWVVHTCIKMEARSS